MSSRTQPLPEGTEGTRERVTGINIEAAKTEEHIARGKLTYGGFISLLQSLGVEHRSVRTPRYGIPIGQGRYFQVYRYVVSPADYQSMHMSISIGRKPFSTDILKPGTHVAIKRMVVKDQFGTVDLSGPGQLYSTCQEITALVHPALRNHDCIVKLQAIIWENGLGTGYEDREPLWPSLVMEYCDTTLAEYQSRNVLTPLQRASIGSKIGEGLDALHSARIFHGDLKSENVLVKIDKSGNVQPKLADFGCSVVFKDEEGTTKYYVAGTELWSAPECPGLFTTIEEVEATDCYSLALLLLRMGLNGRNPFEELGVIPEDWTHEEKVLAVKTLKEEDCIPALLFGPRTIESLTPADRFFMSALIADPRKRMRAINGVDWAAETHLSIQKMRSLSFDDPEEASKVHMITTVLDEASNRLPDQLNAEAPDFVDEEPDMRDPLSFVNHFAGKNMVPDLIELSYAKRSVDLNPATRARIVEEISSSLQDERIYPASQRCLECCRLSKIDLEPGRLTPDTLLQEVQDHSQNLEFGHTCSNLLTSKLSSDHILTSAVLLGEITSSEISRKWKLLWQLFIATATGFGTPKDPLLALDILEQACTSGFAASHYYCRYAAYTKQPVNPKLPVRKWLVLMVLFSAGIPSDAFSALRQIDPPLSEIVSIARSKVYNGSTAAFENLRFNSQYSEERTEFQIEPGYLSDFSIEDGGLVVQNEQFHNTLLHLAAGSYGLDLSLISYCVKILGIDINLRNVSGATPLLLACRAGREDKILLLLKLGANIHVKYDAGETPLHWLGLLRDPSRVLEEFLNRGADINAQVTAVKLLPNFINGSKLFFKPGSPLIWAMAMENEACVNILLNNGADIHSRGPNGVSPIFMACKPRFSKYLPRLSKEAPFRVTFEDAYRIMATWSNWSDMGRVIHSVEAKEQEEALELVLSSAGIFDNIQDVYEYYHPLVSEAVGNSRKQILDIVFDGLSKSMEILRSPGPDHSSYARSPFSHALWKRHRYVHEAARRGDPEILAAILKMHVNAIDADDYGWTPLHKLSSDSDNPDCVDILVSHGALEVLDFRIPGWGLSAFMNAMSCGNFRVADRILSYTPSDHRKLLISSRPALGLPVPELSLVGHFVAWGPYFGKAPLEYLFRLPEISKDPESIFIADEKERKTLLMVAAGFINEGSIYDNELFAESRRKEGYKFLVNKFPSADHINAKDKWGTSALHLACWTGNFDIATLFMDHGADLNAEDGFGYTPLDALFHHGPPFLYEEKDAKMMINARFDRGRNDIYKALKGRGGIHKMRVLDPARTGNDLPRPGS